MKSQNSTKIIFLASIPRDLALIGYEFPSHNSLHPHLIVGCLNMELRSASCVIPRSLHSLSHHTGPLTQLERSEEEYHPPGILL